MSPDIVRRMSSLCLVVILASCAGAGGKNFPSPNPGSLVLGETTRSEAIAQFGEPYSEDMSVVNDTSFKNVAYSYAMGEEDPHVAGTDPIRVLHLHFHGGVLVGYNFYSSFKSDHTDFDETQVKRLNEGDNCDRVVEIFGAAPSKYVYPMTEKEGVKAYSYNYIEPTVTGYHEADWRMKRLSVACDESNTIITVTYTESDER